MNTQSSSNVTSVLFSIANLISAQEYFPARSPEASRLIVSDPFAFLIACCLDRGTKAEIIWSIPYDLKTKLGHLDPAKISKMAPADIRTLLESLPHHPRYMNDAPKTILDLTEIVLKECGGCASKVWEGRSAFEVQRKLMSIHGVGPGIANMTTLLIEKAFPYRFMEEDRRRMDIKPDVHTMRVLYRLGASRAKTEQEAIEAARSLNPACPGDLDGPLWYVGRTWCYASKPGCLDCPLFGSCERYGVERE